MEIMRLKNQPLPPLTLGDLQDGQPFEFLSPEESGVLWVASDTRPSDVDRYALSGDGILVASAIDDLVRVVNGKFVESTK